MRDCRAVGGVSHFGRDDWRSTVEADHGGATLAEYIARSCLMEAEDAADLIDFGSVHIDGGQERNPGRRVEHGQEIRIFWPWKGTRRFYEVEASRILYRDEHLLAYNKESGIPTQQTPSDAYNNLYAGLKRFLNRSGRSAYAGLHHRLDRETSGVMVFALDRAVNRPLGKMFQAHEVTKDYLCWVEGHIDEKRGAITKAIGRRGGRYRTEARARGKPAKTLYWVVSEVEQYSLIWARPLTGRTHQIRLHMASLGCPVVGDSIYGSAHRGHPLMLHAYRIAFEHPVSDIPLQLTAPFPSGWRDFHRAGPSPG